MKLKLGKMTSRELAEWFGKSYNTYKNNISKYLEILNWYCEFEKIYGGVNIISIDKEEYDKLFNPEVQKIYLEEIIRCVKEQDGLASIAGMARKYVLEKTFSSFDQAKRLLTIAGRQLFGKPTDITSFGTEGRREYVWGIKIDDYNHYRFMTTDEEKLFDDIITKLYMVEPDRVKKVALLKEALRNKEIDVDEYFEREDEILGKHSFKDCIFAFKDETGEQIARCTKHELMQTIEFAKQLDEQWKKFAN